MQNLSFRYTRWINWREKRTGHLFQGRYKAVLVDGDSYLLEMVRYIHLKPVRAGMVTRPEEYPWSGHRAYLGQETLPWLTTDWALAQFGKSVSKARAAYLDVGSISSSVRRLTDRIQEKPELARRMMSLKAETEEES